MAEETKNEIPSSISDLVDEHAAKAGAGSGNGEGVASDRQNQQGPEIPPPGPDTGPSERSVKTVEDFIQSAETWFVDLCVTKAEKEGASVSEARDRAMRVLPKGLVRQKLAESGAQCAEKYIGELQLPPEYVLAGALLFTGWNCARVYGSIGGVKQANGSEPS